MNKIIVAVIVLILLGVGGYFYAFRDVAQPTEDISVTTQDDQLDTTEGETQYRIIQEDSKVEFRINEVLNDKPTTAIGTSNQVAGDFVINNSGNPILTIGTVKVDARTFKTDKEKRDAAIARFILGTETAGNEFISFVPKTYEGLPAVITKGQPFTFTVTGDMTISGVMKSQSAKITATQSDDRLIGTVDMTVKRSDYGLKIPQVEFVASVEDSFTVKTTFVANKVN